jgi:hypothetical protein
MVGAAGECLLHDEAQKCGKSATVVEVSIFEDPFELLLDLSLFRLGELRRLPV